MNFGKFFGKKAKPIDDDEPEPWIPPTAEAARRRLMMLWANDIRSWFEEERKKDPPRTDLDADTLREWVLGPLASDATAGELARHRMPLGSWSDRMVIEDSWDAQAGHVLLWALGLEERLAPWDARVDWYEATKDFKEHPDPSVWRPNLSLCDPDTIEKTAQSYEARYWRLRTLDSEGDHRYGRKLMQRAEKLGQVELASDGDLALSDGTSIVDAELARLGYARSVVRERLHALNWLCGQDPDWDGVSCDTLVGWLCDEYWPEG